MCAALSMMAVHFFLVAVPGSAATDGAGTVPILYSTDLHHPHQDPDDHFDLATLFAMGELDVRGIILDCGARQTKQPGRIPVSQMMHLTGRNVPFAVGLERPLGSPADEGRDQPANFQGAVALILDALRRSEEKVTIFTTGSLRDVAAAVNRQPELFRQKVARLYVNIGDASGSMEYNVGLDRAALVCILRSGLPVYWCPCFDGGSFKPGRGYATYWAFGQADVLKTAPAGLQNFFIYALTKPEGVDPVAFLSTPQEAAVRDRVFSMRRNMWCTGPMLHAAGRRIVELAPGRWAALPASRSGRRELSLYQFVPSRVTVSDDARAALVLPASSAGYRVQCFKVLDQAKYAQIMTSCLRELLADLPEAGPGIRGGSTIRARARAIAARVSGFGFP